MSVKVNHPIYAARAHIRAAGWQDACRHLTIEVSVMKKRLLTLIFIGFLSFLFACFAHADSAIKPDDAPIGYADKLFDSGYVHRIDVRLAEDDWTCLLTDPISKTKYTADIVIDGEAFSDVAFSTKGFSSLYFVAYGEQQSRRYSFKVNFGKQIKDQT